MLALSERYDPVDPSHAYNSHNRLSRPVLILKHQPFLQPLPLVIRSSITTRRRDLLPFVTRSLLCQLLSPSLLFALRNVQTPLVELPRPSTLFDRPNQPLSHRSLSHHGTLAALEPVDLHSRLRLCFITVDNRDFST